MCERVAREDAAARARRAPSAEQVLAVVHGIVAETHEGSPRIPVTLDSRLEDDLELFSLERLELQARLEAAFARRLPNDDVSRAQSVRDLLWVVSGKAVERPAQSPPAARCSASPAREEPSLRSWIYTSWIVLLLAATILILWPALYFTTPGRPARRWMRRSARGFLRAAGQRVTVTGVEHLRDVGPVVLTSNHESYIDSTVLLASLPIDVTFVANERLPGSAVFWIPTRAARCLIVDRTSLRGRLAGAARIEDALQSGESIFVFPESTLAPTPRLLPFRLGGFAAAVAAQRPIVPITLRGTSRVLPCDSWFFERGPISVKIHPPIHPQSSGWREVLRLRDEVRRSIDSVRGVR